MLGPEVEGLGEPVARSKVWELARSGKCRRVVLEDACSRIAPDLRRDYVHHRAFERLVMRWERAVLHEAAHPKPPCAFLVHNEGLNELRLCRGRDVRHVGAPPFGTLT